ncbi:MAG: bifunctional adenosylcobinamide kinase/adenosylcobinamide-phosphate guanylyltransferase [Candidatus Puniceispirillaceae bacterium]
MLTHFVIGGARSGKSAFAETLVCDFATQNGARKHYLATAEAFNQEMQDRIDLHIARRGSDWHTIQEPVDIITKLQDLSADDVVLVDCLTIWLNNLIHYEKDCDSAISSLCDWLISPHCHVILVSNEIGLGLVPMDKLSRHFRDLSGVMNQSVAKATQNVTFVAAGLPLSMKSISQ